VRTYFNWRAGHISAAFAAVSNKIFSDHSALPKTIWTRHFGFRTLPHGRACGTFIHFIQKSAQFKDSKGRRDCLTHRSIFQTSHPQVKASIAGSLGISHLAKRLRSFVTQLAAGNRPDLRRDIRRRLSDHRRPPMFAAELPNWGATFQESNSNPHVSFSAGANRGSLARRQPAQRRSGVLREARNACRRPHASTLNTLSRSTQLPRGELIISSLPG
jgi:hypothetical protein